MKRIILLVSIIYLLIAPITYHPDTKLVLYYASLGNEKVLNIYKYLNENVDNAPKFHYPPMNYWIVKAELPVVKLVGGNGVVKWLGVGSNIAFLDKNIFLYNLATKFPLLILLLICGFMVYKISKKAGLSENRSRFASLVWYLNPITIYSGVMMGQNDILAILPFMVGFLFYFDNPILAFTLFGLGSSIKSFPLIWAIALAGVYPTKNWLKKTCLALISVLFYLITILPFLKYDYFVKDVLNSGLAMRMFESAIDFGGIRLSVVPLMLIIVTLIGIKNNMGKNYIGLCTLLIAINFVVLGFSDFNPQWFIWIMPFWAILLATLGGFVVLILTMVPLAAIILLFNDKFLYWGILVPINPGLINLPYIFELIKSPELINNLSHWLLTSLAIYWLYVCARFKK